MKVLKTLVTCSMLMASTAAFAQFSNAGGSGRASSNGGGLVKNTDSYSRVFVGYNPMTISYDASGVDDLTLNGFSVGYLHGFSLSKSQPLFLEVGAKATFNFKKETEEDEDYDYEAKIKAASITVPINVAYKLSFANGMAVSPFFGVTLKGNILGKEDFTEIDDDDKETTKIDFFDKDDVGKDGQWKRFQAGWQIGVNLDYKSFNLGFHYGSDFNELCKKTKTSNWGLTLGYNF